MSAETLLAYEMNSEPLPLLHGFPLRVIVPGYIGARSVKWVTNIHVQAHPSINYFQEHAYKLFPAHVQAEQADWATGQMLGALPLNAVICHPQEGEHLTGGPIRIEGYAITGAGGHIERVELSVDEGDCVGYIARSFSKETVFTLACRRCDPSFPGFLPGSRSLWEG